jgi:hypothetical protein
MAFTIHGIDRELDKRLTDRARRERISKNELVKTHLARAMGLASSDRENDDYREFLGLWSQAEKKSFDRVLTDNERVMDEDRK